MRFYQHLRAPNDSNGNPRRLFVVYETTDQDEIQKYISTVAIHDEGYGGIPDELKDVPSIGSVEITAREYNFIKRT